VDFARDEGGEITEVVEREGGERREIRDWRVPIREERLLVVGVQIVTKLWGYSGDGEGEGGLEERSRARGGAERAHHALSSLRSSPKQKTYQSNN